MNHINIKLMHLAKNFHEQNYTKRDTPQISSKKYKVLSRRNNWNVEFICDRLFEAGYKGKTFKTMKGWINWAKTNNLILSFPLSGAIAFSKSSNFLGIVYGLSPPTVSEGLVIVITGDENTLTTTKQYIKGVDFFDGFIRWW